jgi:hypothetical protein
MGPHSERDNLLPVQTASVDLDFDLDVDTQIDVFVLSPGTEPPMALDRDPAPGACEPTRPAPPN